MRERKEPGHGEMGEDILPVGRIVLPVSGILGDHVSEEGEIIHDGTLAKVVRNLDDTGKGARHARPLADWHGIYDKLKKGEMSGVFEVTAGAIIVTIAGAGFE